MKSISMKLIDIHRTFSVKFSSIVEKDPYNPLYDKNKNNLTEEQMERQKKIANKYEIDGNTYFVLNNSSFVKLDIASKNDKKDYSTNYSVSLNRKYLFKFIQRLEKIYRVFTEEEKLFFYDYNKELHVNRDISSKYIEEFTVNSSGDKIVRFEIVPLNFEDKYYEGIYMSINSMNYYSYLTYDQIALLIDVLKHIDFFSLELQLINTYLHLKDMEVSNVKKKEPVPEVDIEEYVDTKKRVVIEEPHDILDQVKLN